MSIFFFTWPPFFKTAANSNVFLIVSQFLSKRDKILEPMHMNSRSCAKTNTIYPKLGHYLVSNPRWPQNNITFKIPNTISFIYTPRQKNPNACEIYYVLHVFPKIFQICSSSMNNGKVHLGMKII